MKYTSNEGPKMTTTTRRARSIVAVAAAVVLLPGLLTACSGGTPKAGETSASTTGGGTSLEACMREKGYDMPDHAPNQTQQLAAPDGVDLDQWRGDFDACAGDSDGAGDVKPAKPMPGMEQKAGEVAKCIRDGGFSDYPDDQTAQSKYQADDQDAFSDVAQACSEKTWGSSGSVVEK
jgi:hypothetical protein